eukprot:GILI01018574.1.p1 GENE.GILI01018574.1~~GILI01018574.1.p1  ORF type:complete len:448 (+),score=122.49 GILI01018574.1:46-1389(+)
MRITVNLLRKRAEHNEGCLSDLKEITLHQQEIEQIEVIGDVCRQLEIIYLCNNYIGKLEGLRHLKMLQYLNLAVNNIKVIEGLEGCESLTKLDLTLNFISDIDSVVSLRANVHLESLHLVGNGCTSVAGYRSYVAHMLPQLLTLDGDEILKSERISARQEEPVIMDKVVEAAIAEREKERIKEEMIGRGIDPFPAKFNEKGERVYGHTPEERIQILREDEEQRKRQEKATKDASTFSNLTSELNAKPVRLSAEEEMAKYGRLLLRNEGKVNFRLDEDERKVTILTVEPGKYISTSAINIDLQPTYVRIIIKDKLLQLVFTRDVCVEKVKVERSSTTGQLKLTVPVSLATNGTKYDFDSPAAEEPESSKTEGKAPTTAQTTKKAAAPSSSAGDILLPTSIPKTFLKETSTTRTTNSSEAAAPTPQAPPPPPADKPANYKKSKFIEELE